MLTFTKCNETKFGFRIPFCYPGDFVWITKKRSIARIQTIHIKLLRRKKE